MVTYETYSGWRSHLAMMISQRKDKSALVERSIMTMGDTFGEYKIFLPFFGLVFFFYLLKMSLALFKAERAIYYFNYRIEI